MEKKELSKIASENDAAVIFDREGHAAIIRRHYREDGVPVVRFRPDNCDFLPIARWESMTDEEVSRAIC